MSKLRLHLDADTSIKALHTALVSCGHDVTRTPTKESVFFVLPIKGDGNGLGNTPELALYGW